MAFVRFDAGRPAGSPPPGFRKRNAEDKATLLAEVDAVHAAPRRAGKAEPAGTDPHGWVAAFLRVMDPARRPRQRSTAELDARA